MDEQKIESVEVEAKVEVEEPKPKAIQINLDPSAMITAGVTTAIANMCALAGMKIISAGCKVVAKTGKKVGGVVTTKIKDVKDQHKAKKAEKKALAEAEKAKTEAAQAIVAALEAEKAEN